MTGWQDLGIDVRPGDRGEVRKVCPRCGPVRQPGHQRERDLAVNVDVGTFLCHHCGWSGAVGASDWRSALGERPKRDYLLPDPVKPVGREESHEAWEKLLGWFTERGIGEQTVRRYGIKPIKAPAGGWAASFPSYLHGELVTIKYRSLETKAFWSEKGTERIMFGIDDCQRRELLEDGTELLVVDERGKPLYDEFVVIVEGEIDKLSIAEAGERCCVSVPDGAPEPGARARLDYLGSAKPLFDQAKAVVLATDADKPGIALADELVRRIGPEKCYRVKWPDGCKDANDVLLKHGAQRLRELIDQADPEPISGIIRVSDLRELVELLYDRGLPGGVSTGWEELDRHLVVPTRTLTTVTGAPGSGKSSWLDDLFVNLAGLHGWRFAIFSPENQPMQRHVAMLIQHHLGVPFKDGPTPRMTKEEMRLGLAWVDEHFTMVMPEDPSLESILLAMKAAVYREGVQACLIDPWNRIAHQRPPGMNETEYVGHCLARMLDFAQLNGVSFFLVAHPRILQRKDDGNYPVVTPWEISGSAHFYNMSDQMLSIWRDRRDGHFSDPVQVHIQKIRFSEIGSEGMVLFEYNRLTGRYVPFKGAQA